MEMQELLKKVEELKIVPVVVLEDAKDALPLGQALIDGGLPVAEVTFRTAAAADSIKAMSEAFPCIQFFILLQIVYNQVTDHIILVCISCPLAQLDDGIIQ